MNNEFPQIKRELIDDVAEIKKFIVQINKDREQTNEERKTTINLLNRLHLKIDGDEDAEPPKKGFNHRLKALEEIEGGREKAKSGMLKIAVGSLTMAVGGAVIWVLTVLRDAFIKH